jgi:hypothetical protein
LQVAGATIIKKWKRLFVNGCACRRPDFYIDGIFELVPRWDKCISVLGDYAEK